MHNSAFLALGLNCEYFPIECKPGALGDILTGIRHMNFVGFNVTMPLKTKILEYLDEVNETARMSGAVNTVKISGGKLAGYNTDGEGFVNSLNDLGFPVEGKKFYLIGAGGAAKSIASALAVNGANILIESRRAEASLALAKQINLIMPGRAAAIKAGDEVVYDYDCIINATGVGMSHNDGSPAGLSVFKRGALACDLAYSPTKTKFLRDAEKSGALIKNGLGMFVHQGALAFEIWFNRPAPIDVMKNAVNNALLVVK